MECFICKKSKYFKKNDYRESKQRKNTIKKDIIELVGQEDAYLTNDLYEDDLIICRICLKILNHAITTKHEFRKAILLRKQKYIPQFGILYDFYANECGRNGERSGDATPNFSTPTYFRGTPQLDVAYTKKYNGKKEQIYEKAINYTQEQEHFYNTFDPDERRARSKTLEEKRRDILSACSGDFTQIRSISAVSDVSDTMTSVMDNLNESVKKIEAPPSSKRGRKRRRKRKLDDPEENVENQESGPELFCPVSECGIYFGKKTLHYTVHREDTHKHTPRYQCSECSFSFFLKIHLEVHQKMFHECFSIKCGMCARELKGIESFQNHVEEHSTSTFKCPNIGCDLTFTQKVFLTKHKFKCSFRIPISNSSLLKLNSHMESKVIAYKDSNRTSAISEKRKGIFINRIRVKSPETFVSSDNFKDLYPIKSLNHQVNFTSPGDLQHYVELVKRLRESENTNEDFSHLYEEEGRGSSKNSVPTEDVSPIYGFNEGVDLNTLDRHSNLFPRNCESRNSEIFNILRDDTELEDNLNRSGSMEQIEIADIQLLDGIEFVPSSRNYRRNSSCSSQGS